ncbi:fatty acid desaturase [Flavobacterium sp. AC]|uniref:Fatty acid desaturase n=1 Tax=Flavobacterium azizsancarii TaxID=2961580 RepID=A0ABT4WJP1_9FLAO|nr:fatty acid desaturase [Flavobacterium azizsancarii]MDA6072756.1 fatty acid desaturase [Flavobacterium azizsancarii]
MRNNTQPINEISIEKKLRKKTFLIPFTTIFCASILLLGIGYCMHLFQQGFYWAFIPAGFCAHSFLIVTVHDGSHKAITKTKYDRLIVNVSAALIFIPFYGEHYRKYHLIHHGYTNTELDPLASPILKNLYHKNRYLYILMESIPVLYSSYLIFDFNKNKNAQKVTNALQINKIYFILSIGLSIIWFIILQPPFYFILFTLLLLNLISVVRNWCEHMGTSLDRKTNTYWFPMGFGIGNHDVHHEHPSLSWLTLKIGLMKRQKNTNPLKSLKGILFDKAFTFYKPK